MPATPREKLAHALLSAVHRFTGSATPGYSAAGLDLAELFFFAQANRVTPAVQAWLAEQNISAAPFEKAVRENYRAHQEQRRKEFSELCARLASEGIEFFAVKGMVTSEQVYKTPARVMGDFDLWVTAASKPKIIQWLQSNGFTVDLLKRPFRWHAQIGTEFELRHSDQGRRCFEGRSHDVDVHWDACYNVQGHPVRFNLESIWGDYHRAPSPLAPPELNALVTLIHWLAQSRNRLMHLQDVLLVWPHLPDLRTTPLLAADRATRELLQQELQALLDFRQKFGIDPNVTDKWVRLAEKEYLRDLDQPPVTITVDSNWGESIPFHWQRLQWISSPSLKVKYLLGFFLPDLDYWPQSSAPVAVLKFYGMWARRIGWMLRRVFIRK